MDMDQLIDDVFQKEGRTYGDQQTRPPIDQPTAPGGIILPTLSAYLGRPATLAELQALTAITARPIVRWVLASLAAAAGLQGITFEPLRLQLMDFAYNSGPALAIRWLQRVLRVPRDGVFGPVTAAALARSDPWLVHQALIAARLQMIDRATDPGGKVDHKYEEGLESRALTFSLLDVP